MPVANSPGNTSVPHNFTVRDLELLGLDKQGGKLVMITWGWGGPVTAWESAKQ